MIQLDKRQICFGGNVDTIVNWIFWSPQETPENDFYLKKRLPLKDEIMKYISRQPCSAHKSQPPKVLWHVHQICSGRVFVNGWEHVPSCTCSSLMWTLTYPTPNEMSWDRGHVTDDKGDMRYPTYILQSQFCRSRQLIGGTCVGGHVALCILCKVKLVTVNMTTWCD